LELDDVTKAAPFDEVVLVTEFFCWRIIITGGGFAEGGSWFELTMNCVGVAVSIV
jgi:hypothetical protein